MFLKYDNIIFGKQYKTQKSVGNKIVKYTWCKRLNDLWYQNKLHGNVMECCLKINIINKIIPLVYRTHSKICFR